MDKLTNKHSNLNSGLKINNSLNKSDQFQSINSGNNLSNDQSNITIQLPIINLKNQDSSGVSSSKSQLR